MTAAISNPSAAPVPSASEAPSPAELERIEQLLQSNLGEDTVVYEEPDAVWHPRAVRFFNEDPSDDLSWLSDDPLFDVSLMLDECGDSEEHRVDRNGDVLTYTCIDYLPNEMNQLSGQALVCLPGSPEEAAFVAQAIARAMEAAAGPMRSVVDALQRSGLSLPAPARKTITDLLG